MNLRPVVFSCFVPAIMGTAFAAEERKAVMPEKHFEVFDKYCLNCHDSLSEKGGVNLEDLSFELNTVESAELWQKVLNSLNSGEMPPEDKKQVSAQEKTVFLDDLSHQLVTAREILSDSGGVITMRRLNRREYENTVYDLLGVRIDATDLPDDTNSDGFDTAGASLFFSSDQFEQYLSLANQALDAAFVFGKTAPDKRKVRRESETSVNKRFEKLSSKLKKDYDRGQAWRATNGKKSPKDFDFIDENDVKFYERIYNQQYTTYRDYLDRSESDSGIMLSLLFNGAVVDSVSISPRWPPGEYVLRARIAALEGASPHERFLEHGLTGDGARSGELDVLGCHKVTGTMEKPQLLEIPITVEKNGRRTFGLRQRITNNRDAVRTTFVQSQTKTGLGPKPALWIDWVEVEGPFIQEWPPRGISEIFFKGTEWWTQPDEDLYAREIIKRFATRAFRIKQPSDSYLEKLFCLYQASRVEGKKFHEAIREPLAAVMASPSFLYLIEPAPGEKKHELSDLELAVRLSYFLWSAPPDKALYNAARKGELKKPAKLAWHTNRMLDDPRAIEFIRSFTHQWLHMERLDFFQFDYRKYPQFDESVKEAAREEVFATIRSILDEKRPLSDLLKTEHIVVNDVLADYYGLEGVDGNHFRKVAVPTDSPRGGILGMAAVLAMGSDGTRSSPVERGAWVMRKLLDDPPPPAPANVPQLSRIHDQLLSPRELQKAHMEEAQCAQCHRKIDPIGFGLENFDAAGQWRDTMLLTKVVNKKVKQKKMILIDARGRLPKGAEFTNYFELRDQIFKCNSAFSRGFSRSLIEYALGRPYGFSDEKLREQILRRVATKNGEMREFILALVQSKPFRTKK